VALGLISIVAIEDFKVLMKIIGPSDDKKLPHFDLASRLLSLQRIPSREEVIELADKVGFGPASEIVIIDDPAILSDQRSDHNPLLQKTESGYCNIVYIR